MTHLPLVTLYLTERCNSRCIGCDYWRVGRRDLPLAQVERLVPDLLRLGTRVVLLSGGEPLLNPEWPEIMQLLKAQGLRCWLLSSGIALAKQAQRLAGLVDAVTVSLDGTTPATYAAVRGVRAFERVLRGIRAAVAAPLPVGLRITLQHGNFRELPHFIELGRALGVRQVSFLGIDVSNPHAFARQGPAAAQLALHAEELPLFEQLLAEVEARFAAEFASGFIAESPAKLRRILAYFTAVCGLGPYPPVRCNAPEFSAVIDAQRRLHPCFFIAGARSAPVETASREEGLGTQLNDAAMQRLRAAIRHGERHECTTCVCPLWRAPEQRSVEALLPQIFQEALG